MVRAFVFLAGLPVLPFRAEDKVDIVPVNYVADAVVALHQKPTPDHEIYHLSSGTQSQTYYELTKALADAQGKRPPIFVPGLEKPFTAMVNWLSNRQSALGRGASLMKVFMPYLVWNTVFDNSRVVGELSVTPALFSEYSYPLLKFSTENHFTYRYQEWPAAAPLQQAKIPAGGSLA
jgi:nucleoside-diphosphate-sugar epimerase